jgi:hypothetical protein
MALDDPCIRSILCTLAGSVLGALDTIIDTQIIAMQAQITAAQAQLLVLDVATIPLEAARSAANAVLERARSAATLVPLELIAGCAGLGDFNFDLVSSIDDATREFNDIVDDLNRLLSFKEELQALVDELNRVIEQFQEIQLLIQECAQT